MFRTDATTLPHKMQCLGSIHMPATIPEDDDTSDRDEGNAAHWLAQQVFDGTMPLADAVGQRAYNNFVISHDIVKHVTRYLEMLDAGQMETDTSWEYGDVSVSGRADHISHRDASLTVDDFKYGHRVVEPEMHWTLISHAIGWLCRNDIRIDRIVLRIHQPRAYHHLGTTREWTISMSQLAEFRDQIVAHLTSGDTTLQSGPECLNCHARYDCPALRAASMNYLEATSHAYSDKLSDTVLSSELDLLTAAEKTIKTRREALMELGKHRVRNGAIVPNWSLEQGLTNRDWKPGFNAAIGRALTGVDFSKDATITPAQAETRGADPDFIKIFTERRPTAPKLVRSDVSAKAAANFKRGK